MGRTLGEWALLWAALVVALWLLRLMALKRFNLATVHPLVFSIATFSKTLLVAVLGLSSLGCLGYVLYGLLGGVITGGLFIQPMDFLGMLLPGVFAGVLTGVLAVLCMRSGVYTLQRRHYSPGETAFCPFCLSSFIYQPTFERCRNCDRVLFR